MTEETKETDEQDQLYGRNADGTFAVGNKLGKGAPKGRRWTWQCYAYRVAHWRTFSLAAIKQIFEDKAEFDNLSTRDCEIIEAIYNSNIKNEKGERTFLLNREIGGEISRNEVTGAEGSKLF